MSERASETMRESLRYYCCIVMEGSFVSLDGCINTIPTLPPSYAIDRVEYARALQPTQDCVNFRQIVSDMYNM